MKKINLDEYDIDIQDESFGIDEDEQTVVVPNQSGITNTLYEWGHSIIAAVVVVVILLTFVFRLVNIDGESMKNTLQNDDKVIITNFMYTPEVGDIVVIPASEQYPKPIIKRIIALEGQQVYIDYIKNEVYVDGILLKEDYVSSKIDDDNPDSLEVTSLSLTVPEGEAFVMGDNRANSLDSRRFGCIKTADIIGKAQFVIFPFNHFGFLY
ncbi:MAG: signal peptidase I [Ruminococcus sp.]|nr:signal peptidase I [Oscillospiraceae bacterium]